jgi:hypothetical protein
MSRKTSSVFSLGGPAVVSASIVLAGCAQDCGIFTTKASPLCHLEMGGVLIVAAAMQPVMSVKRAVYHRKSAEKEFRLREDVENGGLVASERCLFTCSSAVELGDDRWRVRRIAAERVIAEYGSKAPNSPKETALLMAAHNALASTLWGTDTVGRNFHLNEVVRYGQSKSMWELVGKESAAGNDLRVNGGHFKDIATSTVLAVLRLRHVERIESGSPDNGEMACDFSGFGKLLEYARYLDEKSLCSLASSFWRDEQKRKVGKS